MAKLELLEMGSLTCLINKEAVDKIQELWDKMPNESATSAVHKEYLAEIKKFKTLVDKLSKHVNRQFTIANSQLIKATMRDHAKSKLDIFNFILETK